MNKRSLLLISLFAVGCSGHRSSSVVQAYDPISASKELVSSQALVARDPKGAIGWSQLAVSYLRVARQTDNNELAKKAESAARKSLQIRSYNNVNAELRVCQSILEQHRFREALDVASKAIRRDPFNNSAHQLHAEILTEIGRYDEARVEVDQMHSQSPASDMLNARLLQIEGKTKEATAYAEAALKKVDPQWDLAPDAKGWFHFKYGVLLADQGRLAEAEGAFRDALTLNPCDFKSLAALGKAYMVQGNSGRAKALLEQSVSITPTVEAASLLEDISSNGPDAAKYRTLVDKTSHPETYAFLASGKVPSAGEKPHTHDRLYAMYLADHNQNLPDALEAAKKDLISRQDVYAFDTLAWVLHQMGRDGEAKLAMRIAVSRGTRDGKLYFHAGLIEVKAGDLGRAKSYLNQALGMGVLYPSQIATAREALTQIGRAG